MLSELDSIVPNFIVVTKFLKNTYPSANRSKPDLFSLLNKITTGMYYFLSIIIMKFALLTTASVDGLSSALQKLCNCFKCTNI